MIAAELWRTGSACVASITLLTVALRLASVRLLLKALSDKLIKFSTPGRVILDLLAIVPKRTRAGLHDEIQQVLVIDGKKRCMQEDLDNADEEAHTARLVRLVALLLALLGVRCAVCLILDFDELRTIFLLHLASLLLLAYS